MEISRLAILQPSVRDAAQALAREVAIQHDIAAHGGSSGRWYLDIVEAEAMDAVMEHLYDVDVSSPEEAAEAMQEAEAVSRWEARRDLGEAR